MSSRKYDTAVLRGLLSITFAMLASFLSFAQDGKPLRIELEARAYVDEYFVVPSGKYGVLLLFNDEDRTAKDGWTLSRYDDQLAERWTRDIQFDMQQSFLGSDTDMVRSHLLFVSRSGTGRHMRIVSIDHSSDSLWYVDIELAEFIEPQYFHVHDGKAFILGYQSPRRRWGMLGRGTRYIPVMLHVDVITGTLTDKSPSGMDHHRILSSSMHQEKGSLNVLYLDSKGKNPDHLILHVYGKDGELQGETTLASGRQHLVIDAKVMQANGEDVIILGTYREGPRSPEDYAEGMFMSLVTDLRQEFVRYYPFTDFSTFSRTVPPRTIRKVARRQSRGKEVSVGFRMLIHDEIDIVGDRFVIRAEAYHPEYRTEYRYDPFYGYGHSVQVFEGWRFDHALIAGFGRNGDLAWDQTMQMHDVLETSGRLDEHVLLLEDGEDQILVYSHSGNLYSMVLNDGVVVEGREKTSIETSGRDDQVRANYSSDLGLWYDGYILVWGYQRIKTESRRRDVFFLNKIIYR